MAKKSKIETNEPIIGSIVNSAIPDRNVKDSWNQITLSLASNGGYTVNQGRNFVLYVIIKENIEGKQVSNVKSFLVTKQELYDLESESREFCAEIENMIAARDSENKAACPKVTTKDEKKKDEPTRKATGKALTDTLKKGLESVRKKNPINYDDLQDDYGDDTDISMEPDRE